MFHFVRYLLQCVNLYRHIYNITICNIWSVLLTDGVVVSPAKRSSGSYCFTPECSRGNCTCDELYFQCKSGGCIAITKVNIRLFRRYILLQEVSFNSICAHGIIVGFITLYHYIYLCACQLLSTLLTPTDIHTMFDYAD